MVLICDGGEKYLDTVFNDDWMNERDLIDTSVGVELDGMLAQLTNKSPECA